MTGDQEPKFHDWIRRVLNQLCWDADRQMEHVRSLKVDVDELALEFDDTFNLAKAKVLEGALSEEKLQALQPVDIKLGQMSEQSVELWTEEALRADPAWQELRTIARQAYLNFDL